MPMFVCLYLYAYVLTDISCLFIFILNIQYKQNKKAVKSIFATYLKFFKGISKVL